MKTSLLLLFLLILSSSCQTTPPPAAETPQASTTSTPSATATSTEALALAAVGRYVQQQPNASLYQVDSARALDVQDHWQVLVPRTDWVGRMPNKAAFRVDKQTGAVTTIAVK